MGGGWCMQYIEENERLRAILSEWSMRAANVICFIWFFDKHHFLINT